jgi:hypothetical protein
MVAASHKVMPAPRGPSTLITSPLSMADFLFRLLFFAAAPFLIVATAELFPVRGALIDVGVALLVFLLSEAVRKLAARSRTLKWLLTEALAFETFYREEPPRRFVYYLFYPFLFPYWLWNRRARREFLMFRGYTVGSFAVLLANIGYEYYVHWQPELDIVTYAPAVLLTLTVETFLVLSLLMPVATTVVWYHSSFRRGRLLALLVVAAVSTGIVLGQVSNRRDPIVSYFTRERVRLRTKVEATKAHRTLVTAARAAWRETVKIKGLDGDGKVEGVPLDRARETLQKFYKLDEAFAFDLWASPRRRPRILVLYFEARRKKPAIWVAIGGDGSEIKKPLDLPQGAFRAMRKAEDGTDPLLPVWPEDVDAAEKKLGIF